MSNPKRHVRVDLDADVMERLEPICTRLDTSPTWLVNHLLRTLVRMEVVTTVEVRPEARVPVRRRATWRITI